MRLPDWLDVVLEGGALELQRALAEYRALRRLLAGGWEARADRIVELCATLQRRERAVDRALENARRRAVQEERAKVVLPLVAEVEAERERLRKTLGAEVMTGLLRWEERGRDVCWFSSGLRRFHRERVLFVTGGLASGLLVPLLSWLHASEFGRFPTLFTPAALADTPLIWLPVGLFAGVVAAFALRLGSWSWLGVKAPSLVLPVGATLLAVVTALGAALPFVSGVLFSLVTGLVLAFALLTARAAQPDRAVLESLEALPEQYSTPSATAGPRRAARSPA
ncbi:MAG: hypothetical protein IT380_03695 [Myxococcales bacterium]|nr:hypothetical protein [Myxococcales bacterium]